MAEEEEEEEEQVVVQRLRRVQDAYEQDPSSSSSGRHLCCNLLSLVAYIWPDRSIPHSLLVKLWMSVKDETLKQVHLYNRKTKQCNHTAEPDNTSIDQLIQSINVFLCQCRDLPFDLFWEECSWAFIQIATHEETEVAMCNMYSARELFQGLLHLMAVNCKCESPFLNPKFEEASLAKLYILLRLTLEQKEEEKDGELLVTNMLFPKWNTHKTIRFGFQIILKLLQREATCKLDITQPAWHLLKDFLLANEEEWIGCLASLLHQILQAYLENGPTFLEQKPTRALLRLFSSQTFAQTFLDCITLNPDPHRSSASALSAAFQIFELVYAKHSETIITCCLAKAVDEQSDMVLLRLQCLNLVGRVHSNRWNFSEDPNDLGSVWTEKAIRNLFKIMLHDSSIRVRRSAMQIFQHLSASNIINDKEMLKVCLMKARDQDEKVRFTAFQVLRKVPMKTLAECLTAADWNIMCRRGFSEEKKDIRGLVEVLLMDYITTEFVPETPSARLQILNLVGEGYWPQLHFSFVYNNVEAILDRELQYLNF